MMTTFIAQRVIEAAETSLEAGQAKYRAYFHGIAGMLYGRYQDEVNMILNTTFSRQYPDGYGDCIN